MLVVRRKQTARSRLRWHSFARSHRPAAAPTGATNRRDVTRLSALSAGQLVLLRKLSLLRVTAALERHSNASWATKNWSSSSFFFFF